MSEDIGAKGYAAQYERLAFAAESYVIVLDGEHRNLGAVIRALAGGLDAALRPIGAGGSLPDVATAWDGDAASCVMCGDGVVTWCVAGDGWCSDCLDRARINSLTARAEKAEAELGSGSFYQEKDIDALQDRAEKAGALLDRAVEALEALDLHANKYHVTPTFSETVLRRAHGAAKEVARSTLAAIREAQADVTAPAKGGEG